MQGKNSNLHSQSELQTQIHYRLIEKLSESERSYRELIEHLQEIVFKADHSGNLLFLNASWSRVLGYDKDASIGKQLSKFVAIEHQDKFLELLSRLKTGQSIFHQDLCLRHRKGQPVWFDFSAYYDTEDVYSGLLHNVTERRKAEHLLQAKNQCLAESEARLKDQSVQIESSLEQLKKFQIQMIQSEKMASLGNLVAGVAHEINNPLSFLKGSIRNIEEYIQDLLGHLNLYQHHYPNASTEIRSNAEEIDLEFLYSDLPKVLSAMQLASQRIEGISKSLRTFSRADTEYRVRADLNEGIDSTLLILKYRLKANDRRPAIEVIKDYDNLPLLTCFPGQLNQVFMNILANAIDMFDEMAKKNLIEESQSGSQQIIIRTISQTDRIEIYIRDNGTGIVEEVKRRIFLPSFTTKSVGKGTGLGLAIAHQIVTEKHGGSLDVRSTLGQGSEFCIQLPLRTG